MPLDQIPNQISSVESTGVALMDIALSASNVLSQDGITEGLKLPQMELLNRYGLSREGYAKALEIAGGIIQEINFTDRAGLQESLITLWGSEDTSKETKVLIRKLQLLTLRESWGSLASDELLHGIFAMNEPTYNHKLEALAYLIGVLFVNDIKVRDLVSATGDLLNQVHEKVGTLGFSLGGLSNILFLQYFYSRRFSEKINKFTYSDRQGVTSLNPDFTGYRPTIVCASWGVNVQDTIEDIFKLTASLMGQTIHELVHESGQVDLEWFESLPEKYSGSLIFLLEGLTQYATNKAFQRTFLTPGEDITKYAKLSRVDVSESDFLQVGRIDGINSYNSNFEVLVALIKTLEIDEDLILEKAFRQDLRWIVEQLDSVVGGELKEQFIDELKKYRKGNLLDSISEAKLRLPYISGLDFLDDLLERRSRDSLRFG